MTTIQKELDTISDIIDTPEYRMCVVEFVKMYEQMLLDNKYFISLWEGCLQKAQTNEIHTIVTGNIAELTAKRAEINKKHDLFVELLNTL